MIVYYLHLSAVNSQRQRRVQTSEINFIFVHFILNINSSAPLF